jgi:ribosomal protein S18 acetylase RimI-like enzyme
MSEISIHRATLSELDTVYAIVSEYYEAVGVLVRDDKAFFEQEYFIDGTGFWLAAINHEIVGCIALRTLPQLDKSGEIKRLYVRPGYRKQGIAESLLGALEKYATLYGHSSLYLDTKDDLTAAIRFYQSHGYQPCERYNDNPQATIFLQKQLRRSHPPQ